MSKFSVTLKIGGNWANGVTYVQQATIIVDGRTLKEVEEKAISMYCEDIIKQYGNTNNLDMIYNNIDKITEATCSTCDKCVCEWSITAEARRMKKDESYTYARNYTGVRHYYNGFYNGYTNEKVCYVAYDPEYNKAQTTETTEATEIIETQTTETQTTETQTTETQTTQPDTAERGTIMKKYNINITACVNELNTLSSMPSSFTLNKNYIIEAKDKEDAKQKGREKFIEETLYKGSIYGEYTGERRVAPFMDVLADDNPDKYEDITRNDYFVYRWQINVFVKQYRKPRTQTTQTTEATAQPAEVTEQPTETRTTEATAQTKYDYNTSYPTTEATAQTKYDYNTSYPTTEATAQTTETETTETQTTETQTTEATTQPAEVTTTEATPPPTGATPPPTGATPPPTEATGKEVTGVTILEYRTYNNGDRVIIKHRYFYNADEIIDNYHATDPSYICKYKGLMFGKDDKDYYVSEFHHEEQYL